MSIRSDTVPDVTMTIDELARESGATTRTIRSYQDRGLLPAPEIQGRTGYYNADHVARLNVIGRLLEKRFSLASIGALFEAWETGKSLAQILGFVEEMTTPFAAEDPEQMTVGDIEGIFPDRASGWLERAVDLDILRELGEDRIEVLSPKLLETGARLVGAGVPLEVIVAEGELLRQDCDRIAERFVDMFLTYIWQPFSDAGRPANELDHVIEYLEVTRPLPAEATATMVSQSMKRRLENLLADLIVDERGHPIDLS